MNVYIEPRIKDKTVVGLASQVLKWIFPVLFLGATLLSEAWAANNGVTDTSIRIGTTLPLQSDIKRLATDMEAGLQAALKGQKVQGRAIELLVENDSYVPEKTVAAAKKLIDQDIFLMIGSIGTPNAVAVLPVLAENKVPAVGFYWGSQPAPGDLLNFRPGFSQEVAFAIESAIAAGIKPQEICLYVQDDAYGMNGVKGAIAAFSNQPEMTPVVEKLKQILTLPELERNNIGPVGVYTRDTFAATHGYNSLKKWEEAGKTKCRFVATTGLPLAIASFINHANLFKENWIYSVTTSGGGQALVKALADAKMPISRVVATLVVPVLDASLPITAEAHKALGEAFTPVSMEGFIVGKMFLTIMNNIKGEITRESFLKSARSQVFDLGGLKVDFTNGSQGSNAVFLSYLDNAAYKLITPQQLAKEITK